MTVLLADLKGSMELRADRDPEEARKLLDPVLRANARPEAGRCCIDDQKRRRLMD